jgi:aarF domain-containing kinase
MAPVQELERIESRSSVSELSAQLKQARSRMEEDEDLQMYVQSLRGTNLNTDDAAAEGLEMRLVDVERGEDDLPLRYEPKAIKDYFSKRPSAVMKRMFQVSTAASGFLANIALDAALNRTKDPDLQVQRASELRNLVTSLGPFFIKIGQALSIRPDILPPRSMVELQKLCDKVPPFDSKVAMKTLTDELGCAPEEIFSELTPEPVAAASLGQVYKGRLRTTGEYVAVKVQRPFVLETVSLDLYLIRETGLLLNSIPSRVNRTDLVALVDEFASRFYDELDYRLECENGIRIAKHMASLPKVVIPKCYPEYTSRRVHTAEWIDGEKLAQSQADDVQDLVNLGVVTYLTQLLGEGFFHADPHPGNMIRTPDGRLCILDFGLMTELTDDQKYGMIEAIVHLINRDYKDIGDDFKKLGFIPEGVDVTPIVPALKNVFDAALAGGGAKSINFNELSADLAEITFEYPFRIPPFFALVIRAIGVLEGIALVGNPDFAIVEAAYPYISQRLLTDESPRLRAALRYMVYGREGVFDAERLIDMLGAFESFDIVRNRAGGINYGGHSADDEATRVSTALSFFFSQEGEFFREFLLDETVRGVDVLSRNALLRLPDIVPGPAGAALKSVRVFTPAPLRALLPDLTPADKKTLRSTTALLDFFLNQPEAHTSTQGGLVVPTSTAQFRVNEAAQTAQRMRPVFQEYSGAMRDFGYRVISRLVELSTARALEYTQEVLKRSR